jgi:hypothetical protein
MSQAFTTHHPGVFIVILSLSEGQVVIAWVPSNKMFFPPPSHITRLSLPATMFPLLLLFYYPS